MASTSMNNERVRGLPLSSSMRNLLGAVLSLIDRRVLGMSEAQLWADEEEADMVPATCDACCGTGFIIVPADTVISDESRTGVSFLSSGASGAAASTPTPTPTPPSSVPVSSIGSLIPAPLGTTSTSAPTSTVMSAVVPPLATASVPVAAVGNNPNNGLPPASVVIPGFHSLGEQHPVPTPDEAIFCTEADGPPFYTVTRGKRVGCFGGWDMVSPYVVKANGVVFGKKPSLVAAHEAYTKAYDRGSVKYT